MGRVGFSRAERVAEQVGRISLQPARIGRVGAGHNPAKTRSKKRVGLGGLGSITGLNGADFTGLVASYSSRLLGMYLGGVECVVIVYY